MCSQHVEQKTDDKIAIHAVHEFGRPVSHDSTRSSPQEGKKKKRVMHAVTTKSKRTSLQIHQTHAAPDAYTHHKYDPAMYLWLRQAVIALLRFAKHTVAPSGRVFTPSRGTDAQNTSATRSHSKRPSTASHTHTGTTQNRKRMQRCGVSLCASAFLCVDE